MPIIRSIKKEPILLRLAGFLLTVCGIAFLSSSNKTLGFIASMIGLTLLIITAVSSGIEINTEQKTYRKIYSFFGIIFGDWESLPKTEYLSVYKARIAQRNLRTSGPVLTSISYIIYSFSENRKPIVLHKADYKKDSLQVAGHIASVLGVKILDATEPEQKWL